MERRPANPTSLVARAALVLLAFGFLRLMDGALLGFRTEAAATFSFPIGRWLAAASFGVLAGAAFGTAARYGEAGLPYRWSVTIVVGLLPLAVLVLNALFFAQVLPAIPAFLLGFLFTDLGVSTSAVMLGIAGVAGLSPRPTV